MAPVTVMDGVTISSWTALSCVVDGASHRHGRRDDIVMDGAYGAVAASVVIVILRKSYRASMAFTLFRRASVIKV
jgi:hypothetical protein